MTCSGSHSRAPPGRAATMVDESHLGQKPKLGGVRISHRHLFISFTQLLYVGVFVIFLQENSKESPYCDFHFINSLITGVVGKCFPVKITWHPAIAASPL